MTRGEQSARRPEGSLRWGRAPPSHERTQLRSDLATGAADEQGASCGRRGRYSRKSDTQHRALHALLACMESTSGSRHTRQYRLPCIATAAPRSISRDDCSASNTSALGSRHDAPSRHPPAKNTAHGDRASGGRPGAVGRGKPPLLREQPRQLHRREGAGAVAGARPLPERAVESAPSHRSEVTRSGGRLRLTSDRQGDDSRLSELAPAAMGRPSLV